MTWLEESHPKYARLTQSVVSLVSNILTEQSVDYLSVSGRTKTVESTLEKIKRKGYSRPIEQLTDISGIRIVTYFESQVKKVSDIIDEIFDVDTDNSLNRDQILGQDRIGYRSVHFVCTLGEAREELPEYADFEGLKFELQVRTVLQHAWAELAHDRSYKFSHGLPAQLQRQLNLYSGMLEIVDQGFDELSRSIDSYRHIVEKEDIGSLGESGIDSINLEHYLENLIERHALAIEAQELRPDIIDELQKFGVETIGDLSSIFTTDYLAEVKEHDSAATSYGLLRDAMMFHDIEKYLERAWGKNWSGVSLSDLGVLSGKYGFGRLQKIFGRYGIELLPEEDEPFS